MTLGALAFLNPWLLLALGSLPVIYWLLRTVPPRPEQHTFPPTRILVGIENREKTPAKSPWWLLLIRLLAATLVILALSEPILNPERNAPLTGEGPVAIMVDNGWPSAPDWSARQAMVERFITTAETQSRPVVIVPTAFSSQTFEARIEAPAQARTTARALMPQPFAPARQAAAEALSRTLTFSDATSVGVIWLSDGIDHMGETSAFAEALAGFATSGTFTVVEDPTGGAPRALDAMVGAGGKLEARVLRTGGGATDGILHAYSARGAQLGSATFSFPAGATETTSSFELPLELRNQVARVALSDARSAGAVSLLDARSQWQRVGLISSETSEQAQPLLAPFYYIEKALAPTAEIVKPADANLADGIDQALTQNVSILIFADIGTLTPEAEGKVRSWIEKGGVLVRFAGPRLEKATDGLLPVTLRMGGRTLGGALSWSTPQKLAPFDENSLFAGLTIPDDVAVNRQVLADPAHLRPDTQVWARLADGTPLVTAASRGEGAIVLFHVTGNSDWSSLPISGLFVELLQRVATLGRLGGTSQAAEALSAAGNSEDTAANAGTLAPMQTLDGFGTLSPPPPTSRAIEAARFSDTITSLDHPPGYYGTKGNPRALNVIRAGDSLVPITSLPAQAARQSYENAQAEPLKPWLLAIGLALILVDMIAVLLLQSGSRLFNRFGSRGSAAARSLIALVCLGAGLAFILQPSFALAQEMQTRSAGNPASRLPSDDAKAIAATSRVTLGYVLTGDAQTDDTSRIGLEGLSRVLSLRTAVSPGDPMAVNVVDDELAFYPILYWPVLENASALPEQTLAKIDAYMKQGGMIVFDTRDQGSGLPSGFTPPGSETSALQRILGNLDIPRLEPVPENHVLTKTFYLLRTFPGRWDSGQLWVEAGGVTSAEGSREARRADGVSTILITSNDFASAWALDRTGRPLYPTVPGGEGQREMAFRTGINIVMHALTGNYKADQVHVPAVLERLGQ